MKTKAAIHPFEGAQILPLVVFGVIVIIALAALLIDGGMLISNRREAQVAADAGALAGAKQLCMGENDITAVAAAQDYATNQNNATSVTASIIDDQVNVTTTIVSDTFFAKILNRTTLATGATAVAGCFGPRGRAVMPLAWNCRAPVVGGPYDPNAGCQIQTLDWDDLLGPLVSGQVPSVIIDGYSYSMSGNNILRPYISGVDRAAFAGKPIPPRQIYVVMDSDKDCQEDNPASPVICDLDGDGKKDIEIGGNRGWLYLTDDTSNVNDWVKDPSAIELTPHSWLSGKPGVAQSVYKDIKDYREGQVVLIPVYNVWCKDDKTPLDNTVCMEAAHDPDYWPPEPADGDSVDEVRGNDNYHIVTFAAFYISCVDKKGNCPGATLAQLLNLDLKDAGSVEGFFLHNVDLAVDVDQICDVNIGNCTASLSQ